MPNFIVVIIIIIIAINAAFLFLYLNKPSENIDQKPVIATNQTKVLEISQNATTNQTINLSSVYESNCINSTRKYAENIENITNLTMKETRIFNKSTDARRYLQINWSNSFYDIKGMEKDILNKTVVSVFEIITNRERNFTLPIICNENGKLGNYSSCLLSNIPNIPSACYNLTINLTDCEIELRDHFIMDDIEYWITPPGGGIIISSKGSINKTQVFNFTIKSSRQRLEYFGMNVIERSFSPIINDDVIFSSNKNSTNGKGGSIITSVNLTGKAGVEFYTTIWFKKKCYDKYIIY